MPVSRQGSRIGQRENLNYDVVAEASANQELWSWNAPDRLSQLRQEDQDFVSPTLTSTGYELLPGSGCRLGWDNLLQPRAIPAEGANYRPSETITSAIWVLLSQGRPRWVIYHSIFNRSFITHFVSMGEPLPHTGDSRAKDGMSPSCQINPG